MRLNLEYPYSKKKKFSNTEHSYEEFTVRIRWDLQRSWIVLILRNDEQNSFIQLATVEYIQYRTAYKICNES